ncbi:SIR2 family protein [Planctomicrobium piriforme]|uniref:SIR2-like domain-containing protein n=1 Tax=Planctomicrobium piriforme TaxID=1576369 RepID=A0A1I3D7D2_9PLAN|nr:SIR2 family protein [Planctomicrobium piriforme]SFH82576.1 SIR2-like domain-containing protein [Planctomicrobium piriforme]
MEDIPELEDKLPPMRALATFTNGVWADIASSELDGPVKGCKDALHSNLVEFMRSQHLIVLTGLGTSLCVVDQTGNKPAPTMSDLWNAVRGAFGVKPFNDILAAVRQPVGNKNIELLLSRCQTAQAFEPSSTIAAFISVAEKTIAHCCRFISDSLGLPQHESFLRRIARRPTAAPRTRIFTTNYDLCFETAASRIHMVVVDGFSHSVPQEFDGEHFAYDLVRRGEDGFAPDFIPNVCHLYKLHGSVDWERSTDRIRKQQDTDEPVLIYPRHSKFESSYEHPFLEMMSRFQAAIRQPKTSLLIVGFGFGDKHITQPILAAIRSNVGLRVVVVDPFLQQSPSETSSNMASLIVQGDPRITLVASSFEKFVPLLPDLVSETEHERHQARLRRIEA